MRPAAIVALMLGVLGGVSAEAGSERTHLCGVLAQCGLDAGGMRCRPGEAAGLDGVAYEGPRCRTPRLLQRRGVTPGDFHGARAYELLGRPYQVRYRLEGTIRIAPAQLGLLLDRLPLAARLVNATHDREYRARWERERGARVVDAAKGERFRGRAALLSGESGGGSRIFLGSGVAKILGLRFGGEVLLGLWYRPADVGAAATRYRLLLVVAPANGMVNAIMDSSLFHHMTRAFVRGVLEDLAGAVRTLERRGVDELYASYGGWRPGDRAGLSRLVGSSAP